MRSRWRRLLLGGLLAWMLLGARGPVSAQDASDQPQQHRPRVGLVLSGGGARGLAHVGVLKVLERERVPVDLVVGTSMGAIIGGLWASGMRATQIEAELGDVDWDALFAPRVLREELSQRRKEEDFEISPAIEIGMTRHGEFRAPIAGVSSRGLELLLRRYTLPVRGLSDFDRLPIPFRAVATDMETGRPVVFREGDLATALRSSMSVPGLFAPTEVDGRILGDGGLVDNLPVDVARSLGAEIVIAVNLGTPLAPRETLDSLLGVTRQMINILTEQNVQRSLERLDPRRDLLIAPELGTLTSADFARARRFIELGEQQAQQMRAQLARLAVDEPEWQRWLADRTGVPRPAGAIAGVRFEGAQFSHPERLAPSLESRPGQAFDVAAAERDSRRLAATGDYIRTDYRIEESPAGLGLVFDLEEKPWGPHYFRIGLDLASDFSGRGEFNLKVSHNRHWLDAHGAEWRNRVQVGSTPRWFSELYRPLAWTHAPSGGWFAAAWLDGETREISVYRQSRVQLALNDEQARYRRDQFQLGVDLGHAVGALGEVRVGLTSLRWRNDPEVVGVGSALPLEAQSWRETGLRIAFVADKLDFASFPTRGYRIEAENVIGRRRGPPSLTGPDGEQFSRFELQASAVGSVGRHTLNAFFRGLHADQQAGEGLGRYTLGGFHNLSGYKPGQIEGNYLLFGRLIYYARLSTQPVLTRGFFAGASLEAGNAWEQRSDLRLGDLRLGNSIFVGADTGLGPLYLGLFNAPRGEAGIYLVLGRP